MFDGIRLLLNEYRTRNPDSDALVNRFLALLKTPDVLMRSGRPGHITSSALVTNPGRTHVLLVRHRKLRLWLQPGGHVDGDPDLLSGARREVLEETGLEHLGCDGRIFDLDIHAIPARPDEGAHFHYDVRFLLTADAMVDPVASEESTDVRWIPVADAADYAADESVLRMVRRAVEGRG